MAVSRPHGRSGRAAGRARSSAICNFERAVWVWGSRAPARPVTCFCASLRSSRAGRLVALDGARARLPLPLPGRGEEDAAPGFGPFFPLLCPPPSAGRALGRERRSLALLARAARSAACPPPPSAGQRRGGGRAGLRPLSCPLLSQPPFAGRALGRERRSLALLARAARSAACPPPLFLLPGRGEVEAAPGFGPSCPLSSPPPSAGRALGRERRPCCSLALLASLASFKTPAAILSEMSPAPAVLGLQFALGRRLVRSSPQPSDPRDREG